MGRSRPEARLQAAVVETAELQGWLVYHDYDSRRSTAGFLDLTLVRAPRLLFVELKDDGKYATPAQRAWLDQLCEVPGVEVYLWRPRTWQPELLLRAPLPSAIIDAPTRWQAQTRRSRPASVAPLRSPRSPLRRR
jgi:hypothetical protein